MRSTSSRSSRSVRLPAHPHFTSEKRIIEPEAFSALFHEGGKMPLLEMNQGWDWNLHPRILPLRHLQFELGEIGEVLNLGKARPVMIRWKSIELLVPHEGFLPVARVLIVLLPFRLLVLVETKPLESDRAGRNRVLVIVS